MQSDDGEAGAVRSGAGVAGAGVLPEETRRTTAAAFFFLAVMALFLEREQRDDENQHPGTDAEKQLHVHGFAWRTGDCGFFRVVGDDCSRGCGDASGQQRAVI